MQTAAAPTLEVPRTFDDIQASQRQFFLSGQTREVNFRLQGLKRLRDALRQHEAEIATALQADFGKPAFETYASETGFLLAELNHTLRHLRSWARGRTSLAPLSQFLSWTTLKPEPYGNTLIIAPWNYPLQLALAPLIGAVAAGNTAVIKPSELAPATADIVEKIVRQCFAPNHVAVVKGAVEETQALLAMRWDYIFFTGSTAVGRIVAQAAAKHLTPVTLELGGKSPCIVTADTPLRQSARRILWGKLLNAGQTCVAPDYLLVQRAVLPRFLEEAKAVLNEMYGADPAASPDYARIINGRHYQRLKSYLADGQPVVGGQTDDSTRYIAPTLLLEPALDSPVMQDEIFGPILPILPYDTLEQAIAFVQERPRPLALYIFTDDKTAERKVLAECSFGGGCVNDTLVHLTAPDLPFGGVGDSGMGGYHGKYSFDSFSHPKGVLKKSTLFDVPVRYAPYTSLKQRLLKFFLD